MERHRYTRVRKIARQDIVTNTGYQVVRGDLLYISELKNLGFLLAYSPNGQYLGVIHNVKLDDKTVFLDTYKEAVEAKVC